MAKPVIVEYTHEVAVPGGATIAKGTQYEVATADAAYRDHPEARIVRYADGEKFDGPATAAKAEAAAADEPKKAKAE